MKISIMMIEELKVKVQLNHIIAEIVQLVMPIVKMAP